MISNYIEINKILRRLTWCIWDTVVTQEDVATLIYVNREIAELERAWPKGLTKRTITNLKIHLKNNKDILRVLDTTIKNIEKAIDDFFANQPTSDISMSIVDFLHPKIISNSFSQYRNGHYRDAVFNAIVSVFDQIREKTGIGKDGTALIDDVFSLNNPKLIITELSSESGQNEQKGYIQILKGAYQAIRNPKAHSLSSDLDQAKAAEYLILSSHLTRRIDEAKLVS